MHYICSDSSNLKRKMYQALFLKKYTTKYDLVVIGVLKVNEIHQRAEVIEASSIFCQTFASVDAVLLLFVVLVIELLPDICC